MILWLNGAFGAGKSQAAYESVRRSVRSVVCDPELPGFGLQRMLPADLRGDFQDIPAWRQGVREQLATAERSGAYELVVAPMTLIRADYRREILGWLTEQGFDVRHVVLDASAATLRRRLGNRVTFLTRGGDTWAVERIRTCVASLADPAVTGEAIHVVTDDLDHDEVVEAVARAVGVRLVRPGRGRIGRWWQTVRTSIRMVRF